MRICYCSYSKNMPFPEMSHCPDVSGVEMLSKASVLALEGKVMKTYPFITASRLAYSLIIRIVTTPKTSENALSTILN
jgi:hypothetical protein